MSTNGLVGFRIDGQDKLTYNHHDSYPSFLGIVVLEFLRDQLANKEALDQAAKQIRLVSNKSKPTKKEIERYHPFANSPFSTDWYGLLRNAQGNLKAYCDVGIMLDDAQFINNSLSCEWAYIVNLDTNKLEVYKGMQKERHWKGRYANALQFENGWFPCALIAEYDFDNLPSDTIMRTLESIAA